MIETVAKEVVVTGATGFVGSYLCAFLLQKEYKIQAIVRTSSNLTLLNKICSYYQVDSTSIEFIHASLDDTETLAEIFVNKVAVFHCAACVSFWQKDHQTLFDTNVLGTASIVNACLLAKTTLVHCSSIAAFGRTMQNNEFITENSTWQESPYNSDYAKSKYLSEMEVWRGIEEGLNAVICNPAYILGAGDGKSGSNLIIQKVLQNNPYFPLGSNGFVGVSDVAKFLIFLFEKNLRNNRFLCLSENLSYKDLLQNMAKIFNKKPPQKPLKKWKLKMVYPILFVLEKLRIPTPIPYQAVRTSSYSAKYKSVHSNLISTFEYKSIQEILFETKDILFSERF